MKTNELTGAALDWAVAIAEGFKPEQLYIWNSKSIFTRTFDDEGNPDGYMTGPDRLYGSKWEAGGKIVERERISITSCTPTVGDNRTPFWFANHEGRTDYAEGSTALIAAMRCHAASRLGDEVEIPKELVRVAQSA